MMQPEHIPCSGCGYCTHPGCDSCTCSTKDYTEVCTRYVSATDVIGAVCPECGHNDLIHPGYPNRGDDTLTECIICQLKEKVKE